MSEFIRIGNNIWRTSLIKYVHKESNTFTVYFNDGHEATCTFEEEEGCKKAFEVLAEFLTGTEAK